MMTSEEKSDLIGLLNALCENLITDDQFEKLDRWLKSDQEAREIYVDFTGIWSDLRYFQESLSTRSDQTQSSMKQLVEDSGSLTDSAIWAALLRAEKESPSLYIEKTEEKEVLEPIQKVVRTKIEHNISKFSVISFVFSTAAILFLVLFVRFAPNRAGLEVATIADIVDSEWIKAPDSIQSGYRLSMNEEPMVLRKGYVMLLFDNNATVTVEAPAEFSVLDKDQIQLNYGRVYATVPPEAMGFEVITPELKVIDLGTEFGVQADVNGSAELHVIKGKTTLIASEKNEKRSFNVNEGYARKIHISGLTTQVSEIECDEYKFARTISSRDRRGTVWRGQRTIALNCGGGASYTALDGTVFMKDAYYKIDEDEPQLNATELEIDFPDGFLYETNRYSSEFSYNIPLANGDYEVTLMFAENHFEVPESRIFDVFIEGREVVSNLNIFEASGGHNIPYSRTVNATVEDREMTILLRADYNNAQINAIKIVPIKW